MLCHRNAMSERRNAMLRHRTAMSERRIAMLCHRIAMLCHRNAMSERRIAMLRHRIAMSERRIAMLRHRIAMSERRSQECHAVSRPAGADFATPSRDFSRQAAPPQKIYDDPQFFAGFRQFRRSIEEWASTAEQIAERSELATELHRPPFLLVSARV